MMSMTWILIKDYFHREVEVEQDGESFIDDRWECPQCGEFHDTEEEALYCCQSWADRDLEGMEGLFKGERMKVGKHKRNHTRGKFGYDSLRKRRNWKTTFAASAPKALILDFENGSKYLGSRGISADVVRMDSWLTTDDKKDLMNLLKDHDTIIIDPLGEAMDKLIDSPDIKGNKYRTW